MIAAFQLRDLYWSITEDHKGEAVSHYQKQHFSPPSLPHPQTQTPTPMFLPNLQLLDTDMNEIQVQNASLLSTCLYQS